MMRRFCAYAQKVFKLGSAAQALSDSRRKPQIPTATVFLSALMMFVTRRASLNGMESELRAPRRWEKVVGKRKPSADRIGQIVALMDSEPLRAMLSAINHRLRRNKNLDDNPWALRFVAFDGHEFFSSRKRCCPQCGQRRIMVGGEEVIEYYHRAVVAHLLGFKLPVILDIETIRPGEGEVVAARRLLERLLERYPRFFDAVCGDAIYWEAPLVELCRKRGKHLLAVLKENNPAVLAHARTLLQGPPDLDTREGQRHVRLWDSQHFASDAIDEPFRVVRSLEQWTRRERIADKRIENPQTAEWFWATTIPRKLAPPRQIRQAGHERWSIENRIFNTLSTHWGLDHCFHHHPVAIPNFILILFIAFTLLHCFHRLNIKPARARRLALIAVAAEILHGLPALKARDVAWRGALAAGPGP